MLPPLRYRSRVCALFVGWMAAALSWTSPLLAQRPASPQAAETPDAAVAEEADAEATSQSEPEEKLPKLEEMVLPTAEQLLRSPPVDWVVLKLRQEVIVVEPVMPRPETLVKMQQAIDEKSRERRNLSGPDLARHREELEAMASLHLRLPDQTDEDDYLLSMKLIEQIIHHEDLMLRRVDELIQENSFDLAY
ncbi:MAG: hypothetical protein KF861_17395, partial [Planctomycetaceae bacterium]|nr:hypothetical protein [Planctomycetaceae bacterium]